MRKTTVIEKLIPSAINALIVFCISAPLFYVMPILYWKISVISIFFAYNLIFLFYNDNRCLGMMLYGTHWKKKVHFNHELLYIVLYTASFSSVFMQIWFPFDILLINLLIIQLPTILITGTTLHGYLSGEKSSIIK